MNRREFFAALLPVAGMTQPEVGFEVRGHFTHAGVESEGYYALGQHFALFIDPRHLPTMKQHADRLVGGQAVITLGGA